MNCKLLWTYLLDSLGRRHRSWRLVFFFYSPVSIIWPNWRWKVIDCFSRLAKTADGSLSDIFLRSYQVTFLRGLNLSITWGNIHVLVTHGGGRASGISNVAYGKGWRFCYTCMPFFHTHTTVIVVWRHRIQKTYL